jgi:predicted TIM-barrel fold metal-dependent hydrolase
VSPFFEDDFNDLRDLIGADRILFGSDWPHAEGLDQPADYVKEIDDFDNAQKAAVLGGNARNLIALPG